MKKIEEEFVENLRKLDDTKVEFESINKHINYDKYLKEKKKPFSTKKLAWVSSLSCATVALAIALPLIIVNAQGGNSSSPLDIRQIDIANIDDIVIEYEKNCSFVSDGLVLNRVDKDGVKSLAKKNEYTVDSSNFKEGEVGTYDISVYLNSNSEIRTSYSATVVDDEIESVSLNDYRDVYYIGENVIVQDIELIKHRESGDEKLAKITEYDLDLSNFNGNKVGTYSIGVTLKSNTDFTLNYEVEVKPIEEADLDGRYAFVDDYFEVGQPTIYAVDIFDDVITPYYSEIVMNGKYNREIKDGKIVLSTGRDLQTATYDPSNRSLIISGIAGDPDMSCFRMNRTDLEVTLIENENFEFYGTIYIAIDGFLSQGTIDYLTYRYGGAYLDASMNQPITATTEFENETNPIYVGSKPIVDDTMPYLGKWYREINDKEGSGEVYFDIKEDGIETGTVQGKIKYTVEKKSDNIYWIRYNSWQVVEYNLTNDTIGFIQPDDGKIYMYGYRYNSVTQVIVTVNWKHSQYPTEFIVNKGESFTTRYVSEDNIVYLETTYDGLPLYEDIALGSVAHITVELRNSNGKFGDSDSYYAIESAFQVDRLGEGHNYYFTVYEDFKVAKRGWIEMTDYDAERVIRYMTVHFDDGTTGQVEHSYTESIMWLDDEAKLLNKSIFKDEPFIGTYHNEDSSKTIVMRENAYIGFVKVTDSGGSATSLRNLFVISHSETKWTFEYYDSDIEGNRLVISVVLELVEDNWTLTIDGEVYYLEVPVVE